MLPTSVGLVGRGLDCVATMGEELRLSSPGDLGWWNEDTARDVERADGWSSWVGEGNLTVDTGTKSLTVTGDMRLDPWPVCDSEVVTAESVVVDRLSGDCNFVS
jgi:hypothetical protein